MRSLGPYTDSVTPPENRPEDEAKSTPTPPGKTTPPWDAVLPDDTPPAAAELIEDIDSYQRRMEAEWEQARGGYERKMNEIMKEFMEAGASPGPSPGVPPASPERSERSAERPEAPRDRRRTDGDGIEDLVQRMKRRLVPDADEPDSVERLVDNLRHAFSEERRSLVTHRSSLPRLWSPAPPRARRAVAAVALATVIGATFLFIRQPAAVTPLPYPHASGPVVRGDQLLVVDWLKKDLYVHARRRGLPIVSVENFPDTLSTGYGFLEDKLVSVDSIEGKFLFHAPSVDHRVVDSVATPGAQPAGFFVQGEDVFTADLGTRLLYRLHDTDLTEVRDTYALPAGVTVTALAVRNGRVWILDGKTRELSIYRLQSPLKELASFDLDPILSGATPAGFWLEGQRLWMTTENPTTLRSVRLSRLKKGEPTL